MPDSDIPHAVPPAGTGTEAVGLRTHPLTGLVQGALWAAAAVAGLISSVITGEGWGPMSGLLSIVVALAGGLVIGIAFGYLGWLFTRYVIDGTELRINSGVFTKSSRRIPYERIQSVDVAEPLVARLFGLAELRIEMAGGQDSRTTLKYLSRRDVDELRRVLLRRAHGVAPDDPTHGQDPDDAERRSIITVVPPHRVVIGTILSLDFVLAAVGVIAFVVVALWFDQFLVLLGGIIPFASWLGQIVTRRVIQQWNFTLSRGDRGLRIERGLLSRTSQTIPYSRVQGIAVEEPLVWRRFGWRRLEVDVAGYASQSNEGSTPVSTLLPIADVTLAAAVVAELLEGIDPAALTRTTVPSRSWVFAPIGWRYRWIGAGASAFVASSGWIERTTSIVPHRRTQSVELHQGPWQRRRHVATVEVHSPKGPVNADGRHLDERAAREAMLAQLDRARQARH